MATCHSNSTTVVQDARTSFLLAGKVFYWAFLVSHRLTSRCASMQWTTSVRCFICYVTLLLFGSRVYRWSHTFLLQSWVLSIRIHNTFLIFYVLLHLKWKFVAFLLANDQENIFYCISNKSCTMCVYVAWGPLYSSNFTLWLPMDSSDHS